MPIRCSVVEIRPPATVASELAGGTWYHQGTRDSPADAGPSGLRQWRGTREQTAWHRPSVPESVAEPPARAAEPSGRLISAACSSDFFTIGWNRSLLPDDVPMQPAQDCTKALCVSYGRFRLELLLCRRTLGLFEPGSQRGIWDNAFEIDHLVAQLHTLGAHRGCCFCCASRIRARANHDIVVPLQRCWDSHRDREPICFGLQRSKISGARKRMCRTPMHSLPVAISPAHPFTSHGQAEMRRGG